jgi:type IV pilus assembly protein PilV
MRALPSISPSNDRGFTLVEMLMALLIMTVGLLGLLQSLQVAYQHSTRNRLREEGILLAEEQMNELRLLTFNNITARNVVTSADRGIIAGGRNGIYTVIRNSEWIGGGSPTAHSRSKKLTVTVQWSFRHVTSNQVLYSVRSE